MNTRILFPQENSSCTIFFWWYKNIWLVLQQETETGLPFTTLPPADPVGELQLLKQTWAEACGCQHRPWRVCVFVSVWDRAQGPDCPACGGPDPTGNSKLDSRPLLCTDTRTRMMATKQEPTMKLTAKTLIISLIGNIFFFS